MSSPDPFVLPSVNEKASDLHLTVRKPQQPGAAAATSLAEIQLRSFTGPQKVAEQDDAEKHEERCILIRELSLVLVYLSGGLVFYLLYEDWSFVDALYFVVVTIGTVGYGDMLPSDDTSRLFTVGFVVVGVILLTGSLAHHLAQAAEAFAKRARAEEEAEQLQQGETTKPLASRDQRRVFWAVVRIVLVVLCGTIFYACYDDEEITWVNAFYMSVMTVTTVGYGDTSPLTEGGRIFACFWVLVGVLLFANFVNVLATVYVKRRTKRYQKRRLKKAITEQDVKQFGGSDGELDRCEFALMKLIIQEKISRKDLAEIWAEFEVMDIDKSGTLNKHDVVGKPPSVPSSSEQSCKADPLSDVVMAEAIITEQTDQSPPESLL